MSSSTRQDLPSITAGLAAELIDRFSRQVLVKEIGIRGLKRLLSSRVVIVGCGATGSLAAELLARAGVGFIRIVDRDFVELSNLQRTHLFTEEDARNAVPKAVACAERLRSVSSFVKVEPVVASVRPGNAEELVMDADVIFDGTDNYTTRYVVNDVAVKLGKPWVFVGVERWYGNVMFVSPGETPCLRCLVPEPPEERGDACDVLGVVNTAVSMTVSVAVSELIKYLLGLEPSRELMIVDSLYNEVHKVEVRRNERCPACGMRRFDFLTAEEGGRARRVCGTQAVEVYPPADVRVRLEELRRPGVLPGGVELQVASRYTAKMSVGDLEVVLFGDGRAVVHGTVDEAEALRVYDELLGALLRAGLAEEVWSARRPPQSSART